MMVSRSGFLAACATDWTWPSPSCAPAAVTARGCGGLTTGTEALVTMAALEMAWSNSNLRSAKRDTSRCSLLAPRVTFQRRMRCFFRVCDVCINRLIGPAFHLVKASSRSRLCASAASCNKATVSAGSCDAAKVLLFDPLAPLMKPTCAVTGGLCTCCCILKTKWLYEYERWWMR